MKILLLGGSGQLGKTFIDHAQDCEIFSPTRKELDLEKQTGIQEVFKTFSPDLVVNSAAWTDVAEAENMKQKAFKTNSQGAKALALASAKFGAKLIHISTDFVFDGLSRAPYKETSTKNPISVYGDSKSKGEDFLLDIYPENSYIIRTSWLYSKYRRNFVKTILAKLILDEGEVPVVNDQIGSPTWCADLASAIKLLAIQKFSPGIYHFANLGETSRSNFATKIASLGGFEPERIIGVQSIYANDSVRRPAYSALDIGKFQRASGQQVSNWEISLSIAFQDILRQVERELAE